MSSSEIDTTSAPQSAELPPQKPHISVSQLSTFRTCPRKWHYHYIEQLPTVTNDNLAIGVAMHAGIEHNLRQKIDSGRDCPVDDSKQAALESLKSSIAGGYNSKDGMSPADLEREVLYLVDAHHRLVAPSIHPLYVEREFRLSLGDDFPVDILGYIDCITRDDWILDNKSWGRAKSQSYADKDMQPTAYCFAFRSMFGRIEKGFRFDAIIKKSYRYEPIETHRDNLQIRWWLRQVEQIVESMQQKSSWPNEDTFLCSPIYCDYWSRCQEERV